MKHGSLFSGIGGFDLAAEWMGWENVFHCEWMEFPRKVLDYYWPDADSHIDICKTDFKKYEGTVDIISGGFPCQPFSLAGKRKGTSDERYLWGEMLRAICEVKPKWVIAENVFGITNIDGGMVFEQVCLDLENEGYEVQPFIIPAAAKNAPHRRDRCFFVAHRSDGRCEYGQVYSERCKKAARSWKVSDKPCNTSQNRNATNTDSNGQHKRNSNDEINASERRVNALGDFEQSIVNGDATDTDLSGNTTLRNRIDRNGAQESSEWEQPLNEFGRPIIEGDATDTSSRRISGHRGESKRQSLQATEFNENDCKFYRPMDWREFPTQSPICSRNDGLSTKLDGITFPKWRNESIKGYGNAIVPQIALQLFQIIDELQKLD